MPSELQNLQTALNNVAAQIAAVTANPKPSYSIDGQSISWGEYYGSLVKLRDSIKASMVNADDPYEYHVQGSV